MCSLETVSTKGFTPKYRNHFEQQNNFFASAGVVVLDGLGGIACVGSGVCEVVLATATIGVGVWGVWELGKWVSGSISQMGRQQSNEWTDAAKAGVQAKIFKDICEALEYFLNTAENAEEMQKIKEAMKFAGCANSRKSRGGPGGRGPY